MAEFKDRRRHVRKTLPKPEISIIETIEPRDSAAPTTRHGRTILVYLVNASSEGLCLESSYNLRPGTLFEMQFRLPDQAGWQGFIGKVAWSKEKPQKPDHYLVGVRLLQRTSPERDALRHRDVLKQKLHTSDLDFLLRTSVLDLIPHEARCNFLNSMTPVRIRAGSRFIKQGEEGDRFYIIQEGSCVVRVQKNGSSHDIARLKAGDIVGEIALLTGEPRTASVDAETDMILWTLTREQFDALCEENPDLLDFLTELVTFRFTTEKVTANRMIGKYLLQEIIGRGGWSIVYRGMHTQLHMPVAVKMLKHDMAMNQEFAERFQNEARIIATLNHENIVKIYDIEHLFRTIFIIMEYLEGMSLAYVLERMPKLALSRIVDIVLQVCTGLAYAHEQGIVHQDIKPANIFLQADGVTRIVDFGLSCPPGTVDCTLPGTVYYMSPEQIQGEPVDERTDIYSLGIMVYEMVTGQRPYPEDDIPTLMDLHVTEDVPDPRELIPDLPRELHYFITRATRRDPSERFKTVWEVLRDLQPFADRLGIERRPVRKGRRKVMSMQLFYREDQQADLTALLEKFSSEARELGVDISVDERKDG
ncbi:MAG: protein kinase [Deltaproteobacteria bacterium]|nr:protein kinase [Deltaproteobacteria bacterium]